MTNLLTVQSASSDNELAHLYGKPLIPYHLRSCLTPTGLDLPANMDFPDWRELGEGLQVAQEKMDWFLADWLCFGRTRHKNSYMDAVTLTGIALQTAYNKASVAFRVPRERRNANLTFAHHEVVASCTPDEQVRLLSMADAEGWTVRELREQRNLVRDSVQKLTGDSEEQGAEVHGFATVQFVTDTGWKLTREQRQEVIREWNEIDALNVD